MIKEHQVTPSPSQLDQWEAEARAGMDPFLLDQGIRAGYFGVVHRKALHLAFAAGADQELEACCEWLVANDWAVPGGECLRDLRAARRPNPKSQAEKALASLDGVALPEKAWQAVSAALERLRKLEEGND